MDEERIKELVDIINDTKQAVDRSAFGPLFIYPDPTDFTNKQVNQLAWALYLQLISSLMKEFTETD